MRLFFDTGIASIVFFLFSFFQCSLQFHEAFNGMDIRGATRSDEFGAEHGLGVGGRHTCLAKGVLASRFFQLKNAELIPS